MKQYYLCGNAFNVAVSSFGIHSIEPVNYSSGSRWIRKNELYGTAKVTYMADNKEKTLVPHDPADKCSDLRTGSVIPNGYDITPYPQTEGIYTRNNLNSSVSFKHCTEELSSVLTYSVEGNSFSQTLVLKNLSDQVIELTDLSMFFPSDSVFLWEEDSARKVIAHNFISGHGSYVMLKPCDGTPPYLLMLPADDTQFEYWENKEGKFSFIEENKDTFVNIIPETYPNLYIHSKGKEKNPDVQNNRLWKKHSSCFLEPGKSISYGCKFFWVLSDQEAQNTMVLNGGWDIKSVPGYTLAQDMHVRLALKGLYTDFSLSADYENTEINYLGTENNYHLYEIAFSRLGENTLTLTYDNNKKWLDIRYFITEPLSTLLEKRADFLVKHQCHDTSKWYNGLLCDWDNDALKEVTPESHDRLNGWFVYAICSDDPGLAKPAFLSSKIAEAPVQKHVDAMEDYIEHFVWGGLQKRSDEQYPYGIYGIPNWYENRNSSNPWTGYSLDTGRAHIWRVYDYPHIILMYYNMYRTAHNHPHIHTRLSAEAYLDRAFHTAIALFTYPYALDGWNADSLGLYNELCIPELINALKKNGKANQAHELELHWIRKVRYFITQIHDLFVSEQPVDTTNFESTHAMARYALLHASEYTEYRAHEKDVFNRRNRLTLPAVVKFLRAQIMANISCRGTIEPAYFWYGSDYRGRNTAYTLSYMSQMGGWSILDYALYLANDPFPFLRIGYGSAMSSWALLNSGTKTSDYGYWYPGIENDGAAGGGFEPAPYGTTWFSQPHHGGSWYYSAEIDLGFCGGIRCMSTILALDPIFGWICYGGNLSQTAEQFQVESVEAVRRRFHLVTTEKRIHVLLDNGKFDSKTKIIINKKLDFIQIPIDCSKLIGTSVELQISSDMKKSICITFDGEFSFDETTDNSIIANLKISKSNHIITITV